jgi:hypothetical protein
MATKELPINPDQDGIPQSLSTNFVSFPMREDVKRKNSPLLPVRGSCLACIQPDVPD